MPAPSGSDGFQRGIEELLVPGIGGFLVIAIIASVYGKIIAGFVFLIVLIIGLYSIYAKSNHWNINYTVFFLFGGLISITLPGITSQLVHPIFAVLAALTTILFLIIMGQQLAEKIRG